MKHAGKSATVRALAEIGLHAGKPAEKEAIDTISGLMRERIGLSLTTPRTDKHTNWLLKRMGKIDAQISRRLAEAKGPEAPKRFALLLIKHTKWLERAAEKPGKSRK